MTSATDPTPAEPSVVARNKAVIDELPFSNRDDFADAERGFIATLPDAIIFKAGDNELRNGVAPPFRAALAPDVASALSVGMFFDVLGTRLNGPKAEGKKIVVNWTFSDTGERYTLNLENSRSPMWPAATLRRPTPTLCSIAPH
jgi:alkyl sulfatase BDS1-like metallo-beta-lactamase superfamily hydrolase